MASYDGTEGDDTYINTDLVRHFVATHGGNDTIVTGDLSDNISAGEGKNRVESNDGNDTILSGHGDDWIAAGDGDDVIRDSGTNFLGMQHIFGGAGDDKITLTGGGKSYLYGGTGDDTYVLIRSGDINELQYGVPDGDIQEYNYDGIDNGHDTIMLSSGWAGFVMADNVEDLIALNANAYKHRVTVFNQIDNTVLGVEVTGNAGHNSITGTIVRDILRGADGNDTLDALFGDGDQI